MSSRSEFPKNPSLKTILYGDHDDNDCQSIICAGRLSMIYEKGNIRRISIGKTEIIRMIYATVRDKAWITILPEISDEIIKSEKDSFYISYRGLYKSGDIDFSTQIQIEGKPDSSIILSFEGEAINTFEKNRVGFCVLHPIEGYAGNDCIIIHSDKTSEKYLFPMDISPHQPFKDISSMKWIVNGSTCTLDFFGEIFETEDQRNWSDASYKTYCTPLSLPYPAKIKKGEKIIQRIIFTTDTPSGPEKTNNEVITLSVSPWKAVKMPKIGIGRSTRTVALSESEINILEKLRFEHYRTDIYLFRPDWHTLANTSLFEAEKLGYQMEFALFFDENTIKQATEFKDWAEEKKANIAVISLFHKDYRYTPDTLTVTISPILKKAFPDVKISCGTNANFAQLNRNRPVSDLNDLICYSIHPQEHASDNCTLTENLFAQKYTVETCTKFAKGKGILISPLNIQRRFNANIDKYELPASADGLPAQVDSRLMSLFGACWAAGSLKYLCESEIYGATYFETAGERGIIQGDFDSRWPGGFQASKGMIFPVYHVFRFVLKYKDFKVAESISSQPLKVELLTLTDSKEYKMVVVNLTNTAHNINLPVHGKQKIKQLTSDSFAEASSDANWIENSSGMTTYIGGSLCLPPFSVSFVE
jgi:hypothetical protein